MSTYTAVVEWQLEREEDFPANSYSRAHIWRFDGGLEVPASSSPQIVPAPMSSASAVDPEEAFVASLSSCHMLWFLSIAAARGFVVESYTDEAVGELGRDQEGNRAMTTVTLQPKHSFAGERVPTEHEIDDMHDEAHERCFIASSVKSTVLCKPLRS